MKNLIFFGAISIMAFFGCAEEDIPTQNQPTSSKLTLNISGLEDLGANAVYEGWIIVPGTAKTGGTAAETPLSTGTFTVDANGNLSQTVFDVNPDNLSVATAFVLTIEPNPDPDPNPSAVHILGGDFNTNSVNISTDHGAALGVDFSNSTGNYILATPTDGPNTNENSGIWFLNPPSTTFALNFTGLNPLLNGYHYEGWAIVGGSPVSTGKFNLDSNGNLVDLNGTEITNGEFVLGGDLSSATEIVLTIEPAGDTDDIPAMTHYVAGDVSGGSATLSVGHSSALGDDFLSATGNYILATPTNGPATDENSGVWFLDLSSGSPAQGLDLPTLTDGWKYEGWAVIDGVPVTTGTFTSTTDFDDAAPYSGVMPGPPFPGEDFLVNAPVGLTFPTDLAGKTAVISIEPFPDDDASPFTLKPLVGMIPADATDHVTYAMDNNAGANPTGAVTITFNGASAGLTLPSLPAGWKYEGWTVINGMPVTTGTFTSISDFDDADPYSSSMNPGPPFPGEDFLFNAPTGLSFPTDIAGGVAVISIEPSPDNSADPFTLKPLVGNIPVGAIDHKTYMMNSNTSSFPSGTVSR
jgi:hypothetical protein